MRAPDRSGLRLLRAVVLAGSSTALGGMAHTRAGAVEIGAGSVLALLAVLALSWVATARRVTWPVIALVLAGGQALTHLALAAGHAGRPHLHGSGAAALPVVEPADGRMAALHLGAWVALTWVFTVGERALWRTVRRLVTPWSLPLLPLPQPRPLVSAPLSLGGGLSHPRARDRAPPLR